MIGYCRGNKQMIAPIIFIHYGNSPYLEYTLKLAKFKNPDKEVILLGDISNKKIAQGASATHFYFEDYFKGKEAETFKKVYKFIAGNQKRKSYWTNFVFKRWFCIYNFLKEKKIQKFWTFDSDTLILTDLSVLENQFRDIDCTTQCNGICMNGLVNNLISVEDYINKINELFTRENYLENQEKAFSTHPDWAFTEMRAFATYKEESGIKTARSNMIVNNSVFDENICQEDSFETEFYKNANRNIKKLYFQNGDVFEKRKRDDKLIKLNAINMSWVPLSIIEKVYYYKRYGSLPNIWVKLMFFSKKIPRFIERLLRI